VSAALRTIVSWFLPITDTVPEREYLIVTG
jgi:hypothetical protein